MDCNKCDGKMVKLKYLKIDDLSEYLDRAFITDKIYVRTVA